MSTLPSLALEALVSLEGPSGVTDRIPPLRSSCTALRAQGLLNNGNPLDCISVIASTFTGYPLGLRTDKCELLNVLHYIAHPAPEASPTTPTGVDESLNAMLFPFLESVQSNSQEHLYYRGRAAYIAFQLHFKSGQFAAGTQQLRLAVAFLDALEDAELDGRVIDPNGNMVSVQDAIDDSQCGILTFAKLLLDSMEGRVGFESM
ncbi:hypothetical protein BC830DRAFT_1174957 [Chytriomyces sp. MP71]|nr:hypothetical protein BC830DRAFT_1174957 [Chytriomyces sp. MP71]